jgi:conjugal transfer pilus assembly protein TraF
MTDGELSAAVLSPAAPSTAGSGWFDDDIWRDPNRGFLFYAPDRAPEPRKAPAPKKLPPKDIRAITDHEELVQERNRRLKEAVMRPTEGNMRAYLEANTLMNAKAAMFADMWQRVVWQTPEFDYNTVNPNANFAQVELKAQRRDERQRTMQQLARNYGLVFFYRADCPYCKLQAPVLKILSNTYGMDILPIGLDGGAIEGFSNARADNGISMRISNGRGIDTVPALFLVSRDTYESRFLGAGVLSVEEIVERVHVLTQIEPGEGIQGGAEALDPSRRPSALTGRADVRPLGRP